MQANVGAYRHLVTTHGNLKFLEKQSQVYLSIILIGIIMLKNGLMVPVEIMGRPLVVCSASLCLRVCVKYVP